MRVCESVKVYVWGNTCVCVCPLLGLNNTGTSCMGCAQFWDTVCGTADAWEKHIAEFPTFADVKRHFDSRVAASLNSQ